MKTAPMSIRELPVIDVSPLRRGEPGALERLGAQVAEACSQVGFLYVTGHGVAPTLLAEIFAANRRFHARPLAEKLAIKLNPWHRGYQPLGGSTLTASARFAPASAANQLESFFIRHEVDADAPSDLPLHGANQWPADDPAFKLSVQAYDAAIRDVALSLLPVFSVAVGEDPAFFGMRFAPPATALRLIHYPSAPPGAPYGAHPHTDYGFLTLLAQDEAGGLEMQTNTGDWIAVPPRPGTFVLNIGDALARWTNDSFQSTAHRVQNPSSSRSRYSVAYFFDPNLTTVIESLPRFTRDRPSAYEPVRYGDYFGGRLDTNYPDRIHAA
jgi:isopenicillin N synthase-like dioxygenase